MGEELILVILPSLAAKSALCVGAGFIINV